MPDKLPMLDAIGEACKLCGMCELGWSKAKRLGHEFDPHVPGWRDGMSPLPKIVVVGQNPGWNEVRAGVPFVGAAGDEFNRAIDRHGGKYGITRNHFYITNIVKCFTPDNHPPTARQIARCKPFLKMEINTIRPKVILALGSVAFAGLCPDGRFSDNVGKLSRSEEFEVKVFTTYHPSPLNLQDKFRKLQFDRDMKVICELLFRMDCPF